MLRRHRAIWIAWIGAMCLTAMPLAGQMTRFDSSVVTVGPCRLPQGVRDCLAVGDPRVVAAELRAQAERGGRMTHAFDALVQYYRSYPADALDALADSVAEIALDFASSGDPERVEIGRDLTGLLVSAALWEPSVQSQMGVAYSRGADLVEELAFRLPNGDVYLLYEVRSLIGEERWLAHLRRFATSDLGAAYHAVLQLEKKVPEGLAILRELYEAGLITHPSARSYVAGNVARSDWRKPPADQ